MAIVGGLVLVAKGVAGVVDQANPCGLAAGLGLSNAGLGPAYILVAGGFRLVCGRLVCAGRVQGMGMGMGVVAFAGHGGFRRAWWLSPGVVAGARRLVCAGHVPQRGLMSREAYTRACQARSSCLLACECTSLQASLTKRCRRGCCSHRAKEREGE